jgi:hypothetical protein
MYVASFTARTYCVLSMHAVSRVAHASCSQQDKSRIIAHVVVAEVFYRSKHLRLKVRQWLRGRTSYCRDESILTELRSIWRHCFRNSVCE